MSHHTISSGVQDDIEYQTISSADSAIIERPERLHEWLSPDDIEAIHKVFVAHPEQKLNYTEIRNELKNFDINLTDLEYNRLFLKINQNRDFKCDWNEFISYLIFGFQEDDSSTQKEALILPISAPPLIKKSDHRSPIIGVTLLRGRFESQNMAEREEGVETPEAIGMWITASKEGQVKFWTPNLEIIRTSHSESSK